MRVKGVGLIAAFAMLTSVVAVSPASGSSAIEADTAERRAISVLDVGAYQTCAILRSGDVKCWGSNDEGELGQGDTEDRGDDPGEMGDALPTVDLGTGRTAVAISTGAYQTCAILDNDNLKCWGYNSNGQLGLDDTDNRGDDPGEMGDDLPAIDLGTDRSAVAISAGSYSTCATRPAGLGRHRRSWRWCR